MRNNRVSLFWVKLLHTLIFIVESEAIVYILYSGLFNVHGTGLWIAVIVVVTEIVVFVANGTVCPLTKLARRMGDTTGDDFIADIFLPKRFVRFVPFACGGLAFIGLLLVAVRFLMG